MSKIVDLDALKFEKGSHLMTNKEVNLPIGSKKIQKQGYDEIYIPAAKH